MQHIIEFAKFFDNCIKNLTNILYFKASNTKPRPNLDTFDIFRLNLC